MKNNKSLYSSYNGDDLALIEAQIKLASKTYQERFERYMSSINAGHESYAKRTFLPAANEAKAYLDGLQLRYESMLSIMGKTQGISIIETTVNEATNETETQTPWRTIGLAVGALVIIVIIVKIL